MTEESFKSYKNVDEWKARGKQLFGDNIFNWKVKCPLCGNIQSPEDFRKFKEKGATPETAIKECIGRYQGGDIGKDLSKTKSPCDYAAFGLLKFGSHIEDTGIYVFPFVEKGEDECTKVLKDGSKELNKL